MRATLENAQQLMVAGDRALADGSAALEFIRATGTDLEYIDAARCLEMAAESYLRGAIEYQRFERSAVSLSVNEVEPERLFEHLDGLLGLEARAARDEHKKQ